MKTVLSDSIPEDPLKRQYDAQSKKMLANKYVLANILKHTVPEVQGMTVEEIVPCFEGKPDIGNVSVLDTADLISGSSTEDKSANEGTLFYDIRFYIVEPDGEQTKILFDVEAQKDFYPGYAITTRGIVYGARMISSQIDREFKLPHYNEVKKVYSVWVCFNPPQYIGNAISCYQMEKHDILPGIPDNRKDYDKICVIQICLEEDARDKHDELTDMLNTLFSKRKSADEIRDELSTRYHIPMDDGYGKEVDRMSNLSEMILERGEARGVAIGENRLARLISYLLSHGLNEEIKKASEDEEARKEMYKKYGIID